jgi:hypothetical protein
MTRRRYRADVTVRARASIVVPPPDGTAPPDSAPVSSGSAPAQPAVVRPVPTAELVGRAFCQWREALTREAGDSALADIDRLAGALLDLSAAHPSGIAQLFAGRATRLSNLVREGSALSAAKRRARAVASRADDYAQRYGLASAFLAIGVATWKEDEESAAGAEPGDEPGDHGAPPFSSTSSVRTMRAPVLLRPVTVRSRRGDGDPELSLEPTLEVNPVLATALRRRGALLDPVGLARGAFSRGGFDPRPGLDRLRALGGTLLPGFVLDDRLLVGTFVHPEQSLVDDLDALAPSLADHEVIAALAGDERAAEILSHPLPPVLRGDRPVDAEPGIGDLDGAQARVLDALSAGHHLLVDAPPGSDVAGTVAAMVADAVSAGRTVLYVAGHRRAADAVVARLRDLGLDEAVLDVAPQSGWREQAGQRLLSAMTSERVQVDAEKVAIVERELVDRRRRLQRYVAALHLQREPWDASAYDALQALARLTGTRPAPQTRVRLTPPVTEALDSEQRAQAEADLVRAATLGAFATAIRSSAWYGADLPTSARAATAMRRVERLLGTAVPQVRERARLVAEDTGLNPAASPAEWAEQLTMLAGVRDALDVFRPLVFERSAADLVAATATQEWRDANGVTMTGSMRRRLRKQAKDMVRPGRPVADLHGALIKVQQQREIWRAHCPAGGWPRIPEGLGDIEAEHDGARADLDALSAVLVGAHGGGDLDRLSWDELTLRLHRLQADSGALETLPERTALVRSLDQRGLGGLLADLVERCVGVGLVGAELELAWWSSVFERILIADPALAGHDGTVLTRLVAEFRALDERFLTDRAVLAWAATREAVQMRMSAAEEEAKGLFGDVVEGRFSTLRQAIDAYPDVARYLRPCIAASPMLVPHLLPPTRTEDLVVVDAAGHLPMAEVVPALARGRQVVVVGDTRCAAGSALEVLAGVLPTLALEAHASRRAPHLTALLAEHGYGDRLQATPLPCERDRLRFEVADGAGMPAPDGLVEGTTAEVDRVVELVVEHATAHPERSLAVISASSVHAERVREALLARGHDPVLDGFYVRHRVEPFAVVELGETQGLSRDAVILTLGFGRTPHGRVLHRFGTITAPGGDARLIEALAAPREYLTVVSCFGSDDVDPGRLRTPGALLLGDLLALAERSSVAGDASARPAPSGGADPDRLVLDLAERLWRAGLLVDVDHHAPGGGRIPLVVGHPEVPDRMLVAVLTDDDAYVDEPSVRVRDRQVPGRLEKLGWRVVQVWSAAAFLDPQREADAITAAVLAARARLEELFEEMPEVVTTRLAGDAGRPARRPPRPDVQVGLPIGAYTDDQLEDLLAWVATDGIPRNDDQLAAALRAELGVERRGALVDKAVTSAVRRVRD